MKSNLFIILKGCVAFLFLALSLGKISYSEAQELQDIPTATTMYNLSYSLNNASDTVTFEIYGNTTGYIGFGFTNISGMVQADIFMGGVNEDGSAYFGDYTSYETSAPRSDAQQDWALLDANESDGITYVKFSRKLATLDPVDIAITDNLMHIIWSLGPPNDARMYHGFNRSSLKYNLISNTNGGEEPIPPPIPPGL